MPMPLPANTTQAGEHAYIIHSPDAAMTDCLVIAHGGSVGDQRFTVPAHTEVRFFVPHGNPYSADDSLAVLKSAAANMRWIDTHTGDKPNSGAHKGLCFAAGNSCRDYILGKALGNDGPGQTVTYVDVRNQLDWMAANPGNGKNWMPHIVTVRNRSSWTVHRHVWLSKLIDEVRTAMPGIRTFYAANCRSTSSSPRWRRHQTGDRVK